MHLTPVDDPSAYGVAVIDDQGQVQRFVEKPAPGTAPSNLINAGTYVVEPSVLQRIPTGRKVSIEREIFPLIVADGGLYAMATDDYWIDAGRPEPYLQANLDMIDAVRRSASAPAIEPGAKVDPSALIRHSLVSAGALVEAGADIKDSVILAGAIIRQGAVVHGSIVMGEVANGASITDTMVGATGKVAPGVTLVHALVPDPALL